MIEWVIPGRLGRSPRPGAGEGIDPAAVGAWLAEAGGLGYRSILCLLDPAQLSRYDQIPGGLLNTYREAGFAVRHLPIPDLQVPPIPPEGLAEVWRAFNELPGPMLVHCWAGVDRTGAAVAYLQERLGAQEAE